MPEPLTPQRESKARNALIRRMQILPEVEVLSDGELIDAVVEELAAGLDMGSRQSVLLDEVLDRFQEAIDLEETPRGITKDGEPLWPDLISEANHD